MKTQAMSKYLLSIVAVIALTGLVASAPAFAKGHGERKHAQSYQQHYAPPRYVQHHSPPRYVNHHHHGRDRHAGCHHGIHGRYPQVHYRPGYYPRAYYPEGVAVVVTPWEYSVNVRVRR
jgi:hypothetical protein